MWEAVKIKTIDGRILAQMMISGANHLYNSRQMVNELNVFPVPDGDTGTNMSLTTGAMTTALSEHISSVIDKVAQDMSMATLRGARGNSGVILSQLFRGIAKELKGTNTCTAKKLAQALKSGADTAYKAVMKPTEGTILTVAREAAQGAVDAKSEDVEAVLEAAVKRGNRALKHTQNQLPVLKKAGVVDAGGQGWMLILEGALSYLKTHTVTEKIADQKKAESKPKVSQQAVRTESIQYMYCTEFILEKKSPNVNVDSFRQAIGEKGDCMLVIDDEQIIKVHIHTNHPGFVLERAVKLGAMVNIKIDNMKHQHKNLIEKEQKPAFEEKTEPEKKFGIVAVCSGDGMAEILQDMGSDEIIEGGQSMNPSTEDILSAVKKVRAKTVFVFPNNKNIILAANQAKDLYDGTMVVIPTRSIPECIAALFVYDSAETIQEKEAAMSRAVQSVKTGQVTYAVRDTDWDGTKIKKGDILGMADGTIVAAGEGENAVCLETLSFMIDEDEHEFISLYYGNGVSKQQADALLQKIEEVYPDMEVSVKYGGQPLYYYIASVE